MTGVVTYGSPVNSRLRIKSMPPGKRLPSWPAALTLPLPQPLALPPSALLSLPPCSNLWWINEGLTALHLSFVPLTPSPPVSEALFNFVIAYCVCFLPLIFSDPKAQKIGNKVSYV